MITNYLSPLEFVVTVKRMPNVQFFTQRTSIPGISINPVNVGSPFKTIFATGDNLAYGELNLSFVVDEKMNNFIEVFNWMHGVAFPEKFSQYRDLENSEFGILSDISIVVMNSNKNPVIKLDFINCFPTSLGEIILDTTASDLQYPEATVTLTYDSYTITQI